MYKHVFMCTFRIQHSHVSSLFHIVGTNLYNNSTCTCMRYVHVHSQTSFLYLYLVRQGTIRIKFIEELVNRKVKGWNYFLWVSYKLRVKIFIKRSQMIRINVKKRFFKYVNLRETKICIDTLVKHMYTCTCIRICTCTYIFHVYQ